MTQPQFYRAACGRCRVFLSASDVDAYERGYWDHVRSDVDPAAMLLRGPYADGWGDARSDADEGRCALDDAATPLHVLAGRRVMA